MAIRVQRRGCAHPELRLSKPSTSCRCSVRTDGATPASRDVTRRRRPLRKAKKRLRKYCQPIEGAQQKSTPLALPEKPRSQAPRRNENKSSAQQNKGEKARLSFFYFFNFRTLRSVRAAPGSARLKELSLGRHWDSSPSQNCTARLAVLRLAG